VTWFVGQILAVKQNHNLFPYK